MTFSRQSLLVDYSQFPAAVGSHGRLELTRSRGSAVQCGRKSNDIQRDDDIPKEITTRWSNDYIHIPKEITTRLSNDYNPKQIEHSQSPVSFRLRRSTFAENGRANTMNYMKSHFSDSDLDLRRSEHENEFGSPSCSRGRRDALKRTLSKRSKSLREFHLDSRSLIDVSNNEELLTMKSVGKIDSSKSASNDPSEEQRQTAQQKLKALRAGSSLRGINRTKRGNLRKTVSLKQVLADDDNSCTSQNSYLPSNLDGQRNRRGMLRRQQSFVRGSTIRRHI